MTSEREKDADVVEKMAAGDEGEALERFYRRHAGVALALIRRILGSAAEAEELLQEVFVELWRRAPQYDRRRASVSTWVATIARSRALDALRARRRRHGDQQVPAEEGALAAPSAERPDELAASEQSRRVVRAAIARLSEDQRRVLELSYFRGLSHSEIARAIDIPVGTVKSRILGAMRVLRAALADPKGGER
jgi:RNA polymerase sigma-70 factor, ECF subfamily